MRRKRHLIIAVKYISKSSGYTTGDTMPIDYLFRGCWAREDAEQGTVETVFPCGAVYREQVAGNETITIFARNHGYNDDVFGFLRDRQLFHTVAAEILEIGYSPYLWKSAYENSRLRMPAGVFTPTDWQCHAERNLISELQRVIKRVLTTSVDVGHLAQSANCSIRQLSTEFQSRLKYAKNLAKRHGGNV
jgi:hypothetical protein